MALYDLLPNVAVQITNCPENVIKLALRNALRTFEKDCDCLTESKEITLDAAVSSVDVAPSDSTNYGTNHILSVKIDGLSADPELYWFNASTGKLMFRRTIGKAGTKITVEFTKVVNPGKDTVETFIMTKYGEALFNRALFNLYAMPGKPWSSGDAASFYLKQYEVELGNAIADIESGNKPYDSQMKFGFVQSGGIW